MATLADISKKISEGNNQTELNRQELVGIRSGFDSFLRYIKEGAGDRLEASREKTSSRESISRARPRRKSDGMLGLFGLGALAGLATKVGGIIGGITAGILAVTGALSGLRGWEVGALKNLDKIGRALRALIPLTLIDRIAGLFTPDGYKTFSAFFTDKIRNLRAKTLRAFGFDATLAKFNSPESGLKTPLGTQILERVRKFRTSILNSIGIGADGKAIVATGADGKPTVPLAGRITGAIQKLLGPAMRFAKGITDFIAGAGAGLFKFLAGLGIVKAGGAAAGAAGGAVAGVAKLAGKILLPLGILLSAKDAFDAWVNTEGSFSEKFTAASFAFLGDFIGAPLDLLKKGISFLLKKAFGVETDENGKILPGQGLAGTALKILDEFSFEESIKAIPKLFQKIFDGITAFFKDPIGVTGNIISKLFDAIKEAIMSLIRSIALFLPDSVAKSILGEEEFAKASAQRDVKESTKEVNEANRDLEDLMQKRMEVRALEAQRDALPSKGYAAGVERRRLNNEIRKLNRTVGSNPDQRASILKKADDRVIEALTKHKEAVERAASTIDRQAGGSGVPIVPGKGTELESLSSQRSPGRGATLVDASQTSGDTITSTTQQTYLGDLRSDNRRFTTDMLAQE